MSNDIIINNESLPFDTNRDCQKHLTTFFKIIFRANLKGATFSRPDEQAGDWNTLNYASGFIFNEWINRIDRDTASIIKTVVSKVPCPWVRFNEDLHAVLDSTLFVLSADNDIDAKSLGIASCLNLHAISFLSKTCWSQNPISITKQWDESGDIKEELLDVPNITTLDQLDTYVKRLETEKRESKDYFHKLTSQENDDFPNLLFCNSVLKNFKSSFVTLDDFPKIIEVLTNLNSGICLSSDLEELKLHSGLTFSGESKQTMARDKYARQRCFKHPVSGNRALFEQHLKNFPDAKRMHFLADFSNKTICIGYFGPHLPTTNFST